MEKSKKYKNTIFRVETLKKAIAEFDSLARTEKTVMFARTLDSEKGGQSDEELLASKISRQMSIWRSDEMWKYDSEDEFFGDYRKYVSSVGHTDFWYMRTLLTFHMLEIACVSRTDSVVHVKFSLDLNCRSAIERVFDVFETDAEASRLPYDAVPKPKVFVGHGRSSLWRDLKDHLHDKHGYDVVAYEVGSRAGHAIRDILEDMLTKSSFAVLVMTGEDQTIDGRFQARQNVVHELGLFQGRLGFGRAIMLFEDGVEEFSNIHGIEQIRFAKGNIKETYGEVLATIKREFY